MAIRLGFAPWIIGRPMTPEDRAKIQLRNFVYKLGIKANGR
jgi:hypothetical protein